MDSYDVPKIMSKVCLLYNLLHNQKYYFEKFSFWATHHSK